jgi:hypothetical protein
LYRQHNCQEKSAESGRRGSLHTGSSVGDDENRNGVNEKKYGSNENREKRQVRFEEDNDNSSDNDSECVAPYTGYTMYLFDNIRSMEAPTQK